MVEADIAMYEAKDAGKDRAGVYRREQRPPRPPDVARVLARAAARGDREDGFALVAQPIVGDLRRRAPSASSCCCACAATTATSSRPAAFLHVAERFDLIQDIDRWVFEQAARLLARHADAPAATSAST